MAFVGIISLSIGFEGCDSSSVGFVGCGSSCGDLEESHPMVNKMQRDIKRHLNLVIDKAFCVKIRFPKSQTDFDKADL